MTGIILVILYFIITVEVIVAIYLWDRQEELVQNLKEELDEIVDTELELETIILNAKANKELPFITVEKIEKVLFPDNKQTK